MPYYCYNGAYAYLCRQGDYLYFNDDLNLYAMKLTDSIPITVYTYGGGDGYIYGAMVEEDSMAHLNIGTVPNEATDSYITVKLRVEAPVITVDEASGVLSTTADMEYSLDGGTTWIRCTGSMKMTDFGWDGSRSQTVLFRNMASDGIFTSDSVTVIMPGIPGILNGSVTCFGSKDEKTVIRLVDGTRKTVSETSIFDNSAEFTFENIEAGDYTLQVMKDNHVMREYSVSVEGAAVRQDAVMYLKGDVNGDGSITAREKRYFTTILREVHY